MTKLAAGDRAPGFELPDADGRVWSLAELEGKRVILYFYPEDDTSGCTVEACDFRDSRAQLDEAGYVVLGVSPQGPDSHRRFSDKYELNFPLLVDADREAALAYGAADDNGGMLKGMALRVKRATFVIDEAGNIAQALYGVRARGHVDQLKETLGV
jgi:thioredoxin-dependent peroxiredoxin